MVVVNIEDLFCFNRFPEGPAIIPVLLYFPIGVVLTVVRVFIGLHVCVVATLLPQTWLLRRWVLRIMYMVLGLFVTVEGYEFRCKKVKVMVANYTTQMDHVAVKLVIPCDVPNVWGFSSCLGWLVGYIDLGCHHGREVLISNTREHCQGKAVPVLTFPEGSTTNGKVGLLKFSTWPFAINKTIQPVILQVSRPSYINIIPSVLGSRWWADLLWALFVPYTHYHIKILTPVDAIDGESVEAFSIRVQQTIAAQLAVHPTKYTTLDKAELSKKTMFVAPTAPVRQGSNFHQEPQADPLEEMVLQVKEVLPEVSTYVARRDLEKTNDVDITISNILEGKIHSAEPVPNTCSPPVQFSNIPQQRHLTHEERKRNLLEKARQRYKEKHNLL